MRLVGHLVLADVRRLRWPIVTWLVANGAATLFDIVVPSLSGSVIFRFAAAIGWTAFLLVTILLLFSVLLIAFVVQGDPPLGTDAFWMTRPIDPRLLWTAKVALAGGLVAVLPVLGQAVVMAVNGVPLSAMVRVAADSALTRLLWMAGFTAFAALTFGLSRFLMVSGTMLFAPVVALSFGLGGPDPPPYLLFRADRFELHPADPTSALLATIGVMLACLAVGAVQYRTRLRSRSIAAWLLALCLTAGVAKFWPWATFNPLAVPAWAMDQNRARLLLDTTTLNTFPWGGEGWRIVKGRLALGGMPRRWLASPNLVDATLAFATGPVLTSPGDSGGLASVEGSADAAMAAELRDLLGVRWIGLFSYDPSGLLPFQHPAVFAIHEQDVQRYAPASGAYHGRYRVDLTEHTVGAVLPLRKGASYQDGAYRVVVEDLPRFEKGGLYITILERDARSVFDLAGPWSSEFFLRNVRNAEAIQGIEAEYFPPRPQVLDGGFGMLSGGSGLRTTKSSRFFSAGEFGTMTWSRDPGWFTDVELVIVRSRPGGSVLRTLDIPDFPLASGPGKR
jgi:hypothetical protein